jgi:hypothetical protein
MLSRFFSRQRQISPAMKIQDARAERLAKADWSHVLDKHEQEL